MRNTLILPTLLACASFAVVACTAPTPAPTEGKRASSSNIIGGTASANPDDDSVVLLWMDNSFCTGSLIAPNVILTARHCVSEAGAGQDECSPFGADKAPSSIGVALGEHPSSQAIVARGTRLFLENKSTICGQDIALIQLDKDVPNVKVKKVRLTAPTIGELTTAIGYGEDENQQIQGRMMRTGIPVQAIGPTTRSATAGGQTVTIDLPANDFMTGESVCHGDSGGPLFDAQGQILGTTSRGTQLGCVGAPAMFSSTAAHAELIKTALAAAGHPLQTTPTPTPDAGAPATDGGGAGTTAPGGGDSTGPAPGPKSDAGASTNADPTSDEGSDEEDPASTSGNKKSKGSGEEESESPKKKTSSSTQPPTATITANGCSASPSPSGRDVSAVVMGFVAIALSSMRRRRARR